MHAELLDAIGTQAERARIPLADGTLVATPETPAGDPVPSLLTASDVLGTGWFAAVAAEAGPGKTVAVVGDGAVGLLGVLAASQLGAERIIAMSRHEPRQELAREFGATDIVIERGDDGVAAIKDLTGGLGAHSVIEAVGTQESMMQAIGATRPGGHVGYVGVSHGVELPGQELFFSAVHLHGGPAPVRRFLPELTDLIMRRQINPGKVFDLERRWLKPRRATGPWTNAAPSRPSCAPDRARDLPGEHRMDISPKPPTAKGPAETFTGEVWIDPITRGLPPSQLNVAAVRFTPGARTAWHTHDGGQTLHVTEGRGLVQVRGQQAVELRAGDVIYAPDGEEHWHGATPDDFMTHLSITEGAPNWGDHVTDDEYQSQPTHAEAG